jgi:hypothetical protein
MSTPPDIVVEKLVNYFTSHAKWLDETSSQAANEDFALRTFRLLLSIGSDKDEDVAPNWVVIRQSVSQYVPGIASELVRLAEEGDTIAHRVAMRCAAEHLTCHRNPKDQLSFPIPDCIADYAAAHMLDEGVRKRGRNARALTMREAVIVRGVRFAADRGYHPHRNEATVGKRESACSLVSRALEAAGSHMSESAVAKIWSSALKQNLATLPLLVAMVRRAFPGAPDIPGLTGLFQLAEVPDGL